MALLQCEDGRVFECEGNSFVGRGLTDGISFDEPEGLDLEISSIHAAMTWNSKQSVWELRDLGSHNGTFVGGRPLEPGSKVPLMVDDRVVFGRVGLRVLDVAPPPAHAVCDETGEVRIGRDGVLLLPDERGPELAVMRAAGAWLIGAPDPLQRAIDGGDPAGFARVEGVCVRTAGGRRWKIRVPTLHRRTVQSRKRLADYVLVVTVMEGGDRVGLTLDGGERPITLRPRVHHELLWMLARARLADLAAGRPEPEQGWLTQEQIIDDMRLGASDPIAHLTMLVHRARHQIEPHAPVDYMNLVERDPNRPGSLRLGATRVRIDDHGAG